MTRLGHNLSMPPDGPATHDLIVVLRLWMEAHDPHPRARLLTGAGEPGEPLMGRAAILEALERLLRSFELEARSGHGGDEDETRVQRPR